MIEEYIAIYQYIAMCNISIFFIRRIVLYCSNEYCNILIYCCIPSIVHSDVRKENLLRLSVKVDSKLLGFDLSDRVDVAYPSTYDHQDIKERHPNEKRDQPRCTSHDQYSIIQIIRTSILLPEDQVCILQNKEECLCGENVQYSYLC